MRFWVTTLYVVGIVTIYVCHPVAAQDRAVQLAEVRRLDEQATRLYQAGRYAEAISLQEKKVEILEKALGTEHAVFITELRNLMIAHIMKGDSARADLLHLRVLSILQQVYGLDHPMVADSLTFVSVFYMRKGDYGRAEMCLQRALAIARKAFGEENNNVVMVMNNLASVYETKGDYVRAEPLYQRSIEIREKVLSRDHPDVGIVLNNLAALYVKKGDYARAVPLYERALSIIEKALSPEHPNVATALNNLAGVYMNKGDYVRAESFYQRALAIRQKNFDKEPAYVANSLNGLALLYSTKGDYARAEPLYERALAIIEKEWGAEHPIVGTILNNLAALNSAKGDYARSESFYQRALAVSEKVFGKEHPDVALLFSNLAFLYQMKGDYGHALAAQQRAIEIQEKNIALSLTSGSQQQQQFYLNTLLGDTFSTVNLHVRDMKDNADAARLALTTILQRKGRTLDATSDQITTLRRRTNPDDRRLLEKLVETRSRLATLQLSGGGNLISDAQRAEILRLEAEQELLENHISRRSAEFRAIAQPITLDAVSRAVPPESALVELFVYYPFNTKTAGPLFGMPHYVAYILRREDAVPQWAELGDAVSINNLVVQLRAALRDPQRNDFKQLARTLDKHVMQPIRKLLGPTRRIFLAPDGALNLIPFASLVDEKGQYLIENYSINYLTSGRDLLRLQVSGESREAMKVFANPMYDLTAAREPPRPPASQQASSSAMSDINSPRSKDFTEPNYRSLPGTAEEAAALGNLFSDATLLLQAQATEVALKNVNRPRLLHIATHGFFLTDQPQPAAASQARRFSSQLGEDTKPSAAANRENPLLRSGLIFAGVKQRTSGRGEDGVLTALEVAGLDLWGTKLVVLSACETGLGDVKYGEGVYGLRRALVLAGSETQVMSLWKVSDAGTRDLMTAYYTRLKRGEGRMEALRQVQLAMLHGQLSLAVSSGTRETGDTAGKVATKDYRHPYYWAAFIQSGDWRSLTGQER
jgi:CHAT domain-containing protein/Tfp pilus assembly protein PilF